MTTATATTHERITEVVRTYREALATMPDPGDVPNTYNEQAKDGATRSFLSGRLRILENGSATLVALMPRIECDTTWRDHLTEWRQTCLSTLATLDARDPQRYGWELSIQRIERGLELMTEALPARLPLDDLMAAAGYVPESAVSRAAGDSWYGTLPEVERRLRELITKRDDAQDRIDRVLAEFDARRDMQQV